MIWLDDLSIRDKIYTIRGVRVMLDFDLAEIYGYSTSAFNQQVKRNADKFPEDFRFQLSTQEASVLLSQNVTANRGGDRRTEPWAFSESGIYMLMTVLKGTFATRQSIALIRTFRSMKDYIVAGKSISSQHEMLQLSLQVNENRRETEQIRENLTELLGNPLLVL